MGVNGELHIEGGSIMWLSRKWVQSICFGSIFTCFGDVVSIVNWILALRVGITSLQSRRQALIWSETQPLSSWAHSNTAQQLRAGCAQHNIPLKLQSVVQPVRAVGITNKALTSLKTESYFPAFLFWMGIGSLVHRNTSGYSTICATKTPGKGKPARCECDERKPFLMLPAKGSFTMQWFNTRESLALIFPQALAGHAVSPRDARDVCYFGFIMWFFNFFFFREVKSKNMTSFLV